MLVLHPSLAAAEEETAPNQLTAEQIAEGWISLFDGETLFGWTPTSKANWKVEDGAIAVSEGEQGFLMTNSEFGDYELHFEFKAPAPTNSGVFLRTPLKPTDPARDCIELNIAPKENPFPTASLVGRLRVALEPESYQADDPNRPTRRVGGPGRAVDAWQEGWHAFDLVLEGSTVRISLDGVLLTTYIANNNSVPLRGHIGLQFREGPVAFRNIRLKPLGLEPMLNGKDLAGWNDDQKKTSTFAVTPEGELRVTNGSGQLESDATFGDFTMQFDTRVDGDGLNSGVFFRCIPREYMNGYECQISNKITDGDPTKPTDFGTGAIYRRIPARRVNARDHEWFTTTLVATGPHIAVWVNGLQVTDWTDQRPPNDNPRSGLRTAAGTISLQGHDPTTDIRFRNMRIGELPQNANHDGTKDTTEDKEK
ncbi:MAG: DUF1080 domain-containing protein [Planctomycetaceae bacterium]|nr:DUF1080 domain-containing protein [Planctomycetaceae bacterium]